MKICFKCKQTKQFSEFHKSKCNKDGLVGTCKACVLARWKIRYANDPERYKRQQKLYRLKNLDKVRKNELKKSLKRSKENPKYCRYAQALRRARERKATPVWVNKKDILKIYQGCPKGFDVDHVVPLAGKTVCGLHVPWNLQCLPSRENKKKWNKLNYA